MNVSPKIVSTRQFSNIGTAHADTLERLRPLATGQTLELAGAVVAYRTGEHKDSDSILHIVKGDDLVAAWAALDTSGCGIGILVAETKRDAEQWLALTCGEAVQPAPSYQQQRKAPSKLAELARLPRHEQDALIAAARKRKRVA